MKGALGTSRRQRSSVAMVIPQWVAIALSGLTPFVDLFACTRYKTACGHPWSAEVVVAERQRL